MIKVISGGQTGSDRGGLDAARALSIPTGGWAYMDGRDENGYNDSHKKLFGLNTEMNLSLAERTKANVVDSDGTLLVVQHYNSIGTKLTMKLLREHNKPYWTVDFPGVKVDDKMVGEVVDWIEAHKIQVLNVAGNRESVAPGIQAYTSSLMVAVLVEVTSRQDKKVRGLSNG